MHIVFGWNLDGQSYPETVSGQRWSFNEQVTGPIGLVTVLETKLGLGQPAVSRALRTAQYLSLIKAQSSDKIYSESFQRDAWATAEHLLSLRDELMAAGWHGQAVPESEKVTALSSLEPNTALAAGFAERLAAVNSELAKQQRKVIDCLEIVGPTAWLPPMVRQTIQKLADGGTKIIERTSESTEVDDDLHTLQRRLRRTDTNTKIELSNDGSFTVLDADDETQAAELTAAWLSKQAQLEDVVIIRGADSAILSEACQRYGLPDIGTAGKSQFRAILQTLPLTFELAWRPLDPRKIIEFACIPGGPLPNHLAKRVIEAIGEAPGLGSAIWKKVWEDTVTDQIQWIQNDSFELSHEEAEKQARAKVAETEDWFKARVASTSENISAADALEICSRVERWARTAAHRTKQSDSAIFELAANHANLAAQLIKQTGEGNFPLTQIRRIVQAVIGYGASVSDFEAAPWSVVDQPAQIWARAHTILWWGFAQPRWNSFKAPVWSEAEWHALKDNGIQLEHPLEKFKRESFGWQQPVSNAAHRLVLVKPRIVAGQRAIPHPHWDEITGAVSAEGIRNITVAVNTMFDANEISVANTRIKCKAVSPIKLPGVLRNWKVPPNSIRTRKNESFSSIDKLLGCQLSWVLKYACYMWPPKALDIPDKQLLIGKVAHAIVKNMYDQKPLWQPEEAKQFATESLAELVPQMAASLLLPGGAPQLRQARESIPESIRHLAELLVNAEVEVEGCEKPLAFRLNESTQLTGTLDFLVRLPNGKRAVLDFKWSSKPFFHRARIVEGKALQLALYSWLAAQTDEEQEYSTADGQLMLPSAGFFMFRHGQMFFTERGVFPDYTVVQKAARNLTQTYLLTVEAYNREMSNLKNGNVTATDVDHDNADLSAFTVPTLVDPPCRFCEFSHFCGKEELK